MASVKTTISQMDTESSSRRIRVRSLKHHLSIWRAISMGLSMMVLILILSRFSTVCKEVRFLQQVQSDWLIKANFSATTKPTAQMMHSENLRQDLDVLIIELWSSRTTLILGLVFVFAYVCSWGWMSYQLNLTFCVSLKSVLMLVVFAAVDIAASAGFIMVRVIMAMMGTGEFPRDLRPLSPLNEHDQFSGYTALRLSVLQSGTGSSDILVSGSILLLTTIRVYIVICAVRFYNQFRKEHPHSGSFSPKTNFYTAGKSLEEVEVQSVKVVEDLLKPHGSYMPWSKVADDPRPSMEQKESTRKFSVTGTESITGDEDNISADDFKIQAADMPIHMQRTAMNSAIQACRLYNTEKHIAESVKQDFDQMYGPTWHCIVGRNWGSCVTHSKQCYIRILYKDLTLLLYKST